MNYLVSAFEMSLKSVLNVLSPTDNATKDWHALCRAYDANIQELTRSKVAEALNVDMQLIVELSKRIRASKKVLEHPSGGINDDINILRAIACVEFILKKDISTSILAHDNITSENVAKKQLRAIELSIRLVISSFYQNQDKLISRLKILFKSDAVNTWLSRSKDANILSGTILSELANIFTHPLEYPNYDFIYAQADSLTFLSGKRETLKLFLDDVRFIRNYVAHESKLSMANINLANIYYEQIIGPIQDQYDNGKILVNPESLVELKFESKIIYELNSVEATAQDILIETKNISESVKKISDETKGLGEKTDKIKVETSGLRKKTKLILTGTACIIILLILAAWILHLGKQETSDNPRKELANMGVKWGPESMWNAMRNKDYYVVEMFLKGGMSPYSEHNIPLIWHVICNDKMETDKLLPLFIKYGLDVNKTIKLWPYYLNEPWSTEGEKVPLVMAIAADNREAMKILLEAGANPQIAIDQIEGNEHNKYSVESDKKILAAYVYFKEQAKNYGYKGSVSQNKDATGVGSIHSGENKSESIASRNSSIGKILINPAPNRTSQIQQSENKIPNMSNTGANVLLEGNAQVLKFTNSYIDMNEKGNIEGVMNCFAPEVDLLSSGIKDKGFIRSDLQKFYKRWPIRKIKMIGDVKIENTTNPNVKKVIYNYEFYRKMVDKDKCAAGKGMQTLTISIDHDSYFISGIKEQILERYPESQCQIATP